MSGRYRLEGKQPVPADDAQEWAEYFERGNRRVRLTKIGKFEVSTVFLGLDHNFSGRGEPILFETMTFTAEDGAEADNDQDGRASTWSEAEDMHQRAVDWIFKNRAEPGDKAVDLEKR